MNNKFDFKGHLERFPKPIRNQISLNYDAKSCAKNNDKRSSHSRDIICKRIKQYDLQSNFWARTQEPDH